MGLFDELKKISKGDIEKFGKDVVSNIQNVTNEITKNVSEDLKNTTGFNTEAKKGKEIPAEYSDFPVFKAPDDLETKDTNKYKRCSMTFYSSSYNSEEVGQYVLKIQSLGYYKGSKVRYDKGNTYIIVDEDAPNGLNIVFHIKK